MKRRAFPVLTLVVICLVLGVVAALVWVKWSSSPPPAPTGPNALQFVDTLFGPETDLATRKENLGEIRGFTHYSYPGGEAGYMEALKNAAASGERGGAAIAGSGGAAASPTPNAANMLALQVGVKALATEANFLLIEGKRSEALNILADLFRVGRLMADSNLFLSRMCGLLICKIAGRQLEDYVVNACETPADCAEAVEALEPLMKGFEPITPDEIMDRVEPPPMSWVMRLLYKKIITKGMERSGRKHNETVAHIRLIVLAAAARRHVSLQGSFPDSATQLAEILPDGVPADPFVQGDTPLRLRVDSATGEFQCWSVGSNGVDETGASAGPAVLPAGDDIVFALPLRAIKPFPRESIRANSAEEFLLAFPGGLPVDLFSNVSGRSLITVDSRPVRVLSVGPDKERSTDPETGEPIAYDPTNGTVSPGDLIIEIAPKQGAE